MVPAMGQVPVENSEIGASDNRAHNHQEGRTNTQIRSTLPGFRKLALFRSKRAPGAPRQAGVKGNSESEGEEGGEVRKR